MLKEILLSIPISLTPIYTLNESQNNLVYKDVEQGISLASSQEYKETTTVGRNEYYECANIIKTDAEPYQLQGLKVWQKTYVYKISNYRQTQGTTITNYSILYVYIIQPDTNVFIGGLYLDPVINFPYLQNGLENAIWKITKTYPKQASNILTNNDLLLLKEKISLNENEIDRIEENQVQIDDLVTNAQGQTYEYQDSIKTYSELQNCNFMIEDLTWQYQDTTTYVGSIRIDMSITDTGKVNKTELMYFGNIPSQTILTYNLGHQPSTEGIIDISNLILLILASPFAFISQAFNVTLWEGTAFAINIGHILLAIITAGLALYIIRKFLK